jgi:hypothetical protein
MKKRKRKNVRKSDKQPFITCTTRQSRGTTLRLAHVEFSNQTLQPSCFAE